MAPAGHTQARAGLNALGLGTAPITKNRGVGTNSGTGVVAASDVTAFTNESISGGAVTVYNSAGTPVNLQLRWALVSNTGGQDTWNLFYENDSTASGPNAMWTNVGTNFTFNTDGNLISPSGSGITIPNLMVNQQTIGNGGAEFRLRRLTQFARHHRRGNGQPDTT